MRISLNQVFLWTALLAGPVAAGEFTKAAKEAGFETLKIQLGTGLSDLSGLDKATISRTALTLKTTLSLTGDFKFNFDGGLKYETGASKSAFNKRRYAPKSGTTYSYGYISYAPFSFIKFHGGALDNRDTDYVSYFANYNTTAFGAREILELKGDLLSVVASATQAIPYNDELSNRIGEIDEKRAKFYSEMISAKLALSMFELKAHVGHYAYEDLASDVAASDRFFGNTVSGENEFSEYNYSFKGWVYGAEAKFKLKTLKVTTSVNMIKNDEAPEGKNTGTNTALKLETSLADNQVALTIGQFENESDTAPAFYNSSLFKNDYKGNYVHLKISNPENLETSLKLINREPINNMSKVLGNEKVIIIGLRKTYDIF